MIEVWKENVKKVQNGKIADFQSASPPLSIVIGNNICTVINCSQWGSLV